MRNLQPKPKIISQSHIQVIPPQNDIPAAEYNAWEVPSIL